MLYPPPLPVVRVRRCHLRVFKLLAESVAAGPSSSSCAASSLQTLGLVPAADMPARILPRGAARHWRLATLQIFAFPTLVKAEVKA